jgi:hypothetical protein
MSRANKLLLMRLIFSKKLARTVAAAHQNAIISICAVPAGAVPLSGAAFVTCSRGNGTGTGFDYGTIRLWSLAGDAVSMKERETFVEELRCEASVSKVIITVNNLGHTLIAACYAKTDKKTGIELWNIDTGTYRRWEEGIPNSKIQLSSYCF